ncbi:phage baseplate assembly protein [Agrobacterium salinitolerans]|uniref:phage baseplate assembly protein domain-containing protein n=1 Tax=Agrobacterium salinitolerans TaxID=1183413 RepID=UPI0022B82248|nr:phage baseplate assembly protein [Agrobacterium salinitolerans]MCZ7893313.1 phage baseplate assembly protein [Agrobacterium salinitolerans]
MSETEIVNKLRGLVRRVTVKDIKDEGQMQTASAEVAEGVWRDDLEVMLPYGLLSVPDDDGAVGVALAIGGDEGDMVILPLANPSQRIGGLSKGDVGIGNKFGDRMIVKASGGIEVQAASSITFKVGGVTMTLDETGLNVNGGSIKHDGVVIDKTHKHKGVVPGSGDSSVPVGG